MKLSTILTKLILVALLLLPEFVLAQNQTISVNGSQIQISSTLQTVFDQAESVYVPHGYKIDAVYKDAPDMIPLFLGLIMQRQEIYMNQIRNVNHLKNNTSLHDEIATFIGQLAKAHNYINPINESKMSPITMHESFMDALKGKYNSLYINKFGINPTTTNIAYLLDRAPNTNNVAANTDDHAKLWGNDDKALTEIKLFGEVSPGVKSSVKPIGNKEMVNALAKPEKPQKTPVEKGVILGRWTGFKFYYAGDGEGEHKPGHDIVFSKGTGRAFTRGPEMYRGTKKNGTQYYVVSEKQVDQHTIVYEAYVDFPDTMTKVKGGAAYAGCDGKVIEIEVSSTLVRGKGSKEYRTGFKLWKNDCRRFIPAFSYVK